MINLNKEGKYLLALSGGPDSMALFQVLLKQNYQFHACHVDHGWRAESCDEARQLEEWCRKEGVPFYLRKLEGVPQKEDISREKRLQFFKEVYETYKFDALLMAHHADDQVETILKRVFEGSSLSHLSGMKSETNLWGMRIVRPFLHLFKSDIINLLGDRPFFEDSTNRDPKFLRGRMREEMIPYLEKVFGKGIKENILLLGERIEKSFKQPNNIMVEKSPFGYRIEKNEEILRRVLAYEKISLPRGEIKKALQGKRVIRGEWIIVVEQDKLFIVKSLKPSEWFCFQPSEGGNLGLPQLKGKMSNGIELREWYRIHKVPKCLRLLVPVVWKGDKIVGEYLTDNSLYQRSQIIF